MKDLRTLAAGFLLIPFILAGAPAAGHAVEEGIDVIETGSSFLCFAKERITPRPETDQRPATDLWLRDLKGGEAVAVVEETTVVEARLSPDERHLAILKAGGRLEIVGLPSLDFVVNPVEAVAGDLAWSPGGDALLVTAYEEDRVGSDLLLVDLADGLRRRLTDTPGVDDRPVWSPDGRKILFVSGRTGIASLWVMGRDGSGMTQVTNKGIRGGIGRAPEGFVPVPLSTKTIVWEGGEKVTYAAGDGHWRVDFAGEAQRIETMPHRRVP